MITLITGAPGAGKTNALVQLLSELSSSRTIYVSGIDDLQVAHVPLDDPRTWHETVPDGAIVVIDEVQRVWRPYRGTVPPDIAALETHRHKGVDFFIVTQGPNLVHQNVRALVGRHVHLRDTGILGRWWYEWPECSDRVAWKTAPIRKSYRLDKASQKLYTSASIHTKPIRSFPRALIVAIVAIVAGLGLVYRAYDSISARVAGKAPTVARSASGAASGAVPAMARYREIPDDEVVPVRRWVNGKLSVDPPAERSSFVAATSVMPSEPMGCISDDRRCRCYSAGSLVDVSMQQCRDTIGIAGKVLPLDRVPVLSSIADARPQSPFPVAPDRRPPSSRPTPVADAP